MKLAAVSLVMVEPFNVTFTIRALLYPTHRTPLLIRTGRRKSGGGGVGDEAVKGQFSSALRPQNTPLRVVKDIRIFYTLSLPMNLPIKLRLVKPVTTRSCRPYKKLWFSQGQF